MGGALAFRRGVLREAGGSQKLSQLASHGTGHGGGDLIRQIMGWGATGRGDDRG